MFPEESPDTVLEAAGEVSDCSSVWRGPAAGTQQVGCVFVEIQATNNCFTHANHSTHNPQLVQTQTRHRAASL